MLETQFKQYRFRRELSWTNQLWFNLYFTVLIPTSYCLVSTMVCCHLIRLKYYHKALRLLPSVRHKSCPLLYFWTYTILKLLATNVYHIETMCGIHVTSIFVSWYISYLEINITWLKYMFVTNRIQSVTFFGWIQ